MGELEAIKVGTELGEGGAQGGSKFQYQGCIRGGLAKGEEGNGRVHLEELIHEGDQGLMVTSHHIFAHKFCIWDHQVKVEEVLARVWARQEGGLGGVLGSSRGLGWGRSCWGKGGLGEVHFHSWRAGLGRVGIHIHGSLVASRGGSSWAGVALGSLEHLGNVTSGSAFGQRGLGFHHGTVGAGGRPKAAKRCTTR